MQLTLLFLVLTSLSSSLLGQEASQESGNSSGDTISMVQIIFRHGEREPVESAATVEGPLNEAGKLQMFKLGRYFRERYPNLVGTTFDSLTVSFRSSDRERNLQSTSLVAYGFFKQFNSDADWTRGDPIGYDPIPVKSSAPKYDWIFLRSKICPRYEELVQGNAREFIRKFRQAYPDLIRVYEQFTGKRFNGKSSNPKSEVSEFLFVHDEASVNFAHNLMGKIPDWILPYAGPNFPSPQLLWEQFQMTGEEQRKLYEGPMIKVLLDEFTSGNKKLIFYGGHDRNVFGLLDIFHLWDEADVQMPPLGSAVMLELHETLEDQHLEIWYRNSTRQPPRLLKIPECEEKCRFERVQQLMKPYQDADYRAECKI